MDVGIFSLASPNSKPAWPGGYPEPVVDQVPGTADPGDEAAGQPES